ncbi:MAG: AAA family ATPase [Planctomycetaceae bacterium]
MFIERIDVERFGALSRTTLDRLAPGVQVLHGTNETGKTTLLEFVRAVFFGFEGQFRRGVLDPRVPCAGRLLVRTGPERTLLAVERRHEGPHLEALTRAAYEDDVIGLGGDTGDLVRIEDIDPRTTDRHRVYLQDLVGGIDETTFTNVMAFGLDELHELRTLEPEGCGSRLYELASGLDRSKVARVLAHLREALARLDSADPAVSPLASLRARQSDLADRLAALGAPALAAGGLWAELTHLDAELDGLAARIAEAERAEQVARGVLPLAELHDAWRRTAERRATLEQTPLVHPDRDAWRFAARRHKRLARLAVRRKKTRAKLARALRELPAESPVWKHRVAVAALVEDQPRLERVVADVARAEAHARLAARRFGEQVGIAGLSRVLPIAAGLDAAGDALPDVLLPEGFAHSFGPLRSRARDCAVTAKEVAAARRELAEARRAHDETRGGVKGAHAALGGLTIAAAIEAAAGHAAALRRRIAAGEQAADLDRAIVRLEHEVSDSLANQLVPAPWLIALGALFVVGTGMLLSGLLLPASVTGSLAYAMAALGLAGTGVASVTTWTLDKSATQRLEAARNQLETTRRQRADLAAQLAGLDATLGGDAAGTLERRLAAAQAETERLEALAAREGSVHVLADRITVAEQALARATEARTGARHRWRRALEHRGLPPTLSPREVRQIATHRHTLLTLDDDRRRLSEEARHKREEVAAFARRIDELLVECELLPETTPLEHLRLLQERLDADKAVIRRRASLARRLEAARRRHRHTLRQVRMAERAVREFFTRWDVADEPAFLAKVDRRPEYELARAEAEAAETAWLDARRRTTEPPDVDRWLAERAAVPLEQRLADAVAATARHRQALTAARDRRRAVAARVEAAAHDHGTESLQVELADVEARLAEQVDRRRLLERARELLEETRAAVARDHQPPVLREAARWLARLTGGRYPSITTAIDEAKLEVHEADGAVWNPERLSRGTREQVFLALRLALIRDLGRHDVSLPVVMDDALVNFDDGRARLAARVLVEFVAEQGAGRQMLVLTCHEHVAAMFREAGATVRPLSGDPPPPRRVTPPAPVVVEPVAPPAPVRRPPPAPSGTWPAEEFFFGSRAAADPPRRQAGRRQRRT